MTNNTPLRERVRQAICHATCVICDPSECRSYDRDTQEADAAIQEVFDWLEEFGATKRADGGMRDLQQFGEVLAEARKRAGV